MLTHRVGAVGHFQRKYAEYSRDNRQTGSLYIVECNRAIKFNSFEN